jgi:hypothetical protein
MSAGTKGGAVKVEEHPVGYDRDQILKFWDEAMGRIAQNLDDPTDEEIAASMAEVRAICPGLAPEEVRDALRSSVEEEERKVACAKRTLQTLKMMMDERGDKPLPGLPGGPPLKH